MRATWLRWRVTICQRGGCPIPPLAAARGGRRLISLLSLAIALLCLAVPQARGAAELALLHDMELAADALLMPATAPYGRAINGVSFQTEPFLTYNGYQYAAWYRARGFSSEDFMLARRELNSTTWEDFDTGQNLSNGDNNWDAHNVISMGVSGDGRMHFSWDMHNNTLKYMNSLTGVVTSPGGITWDANLLNNDRGSLNDGGPTIVDVTYPRYITKPNGDLIMTYRTGGSGNGNMNFATYGATNGDWDTPHQIINGTGSIFYDDDYGNASNERNAYLNGLDVGPDGDIHITWTWREQATGSSNHDIMYAYSEDGGDTWKNSDGDVVGTVGSPIDLNSPGITVVPMDRGNTLMNQQAQTVTSDGGVHAIMWHRKDGEPPLTGFTAGPAAYFHYFRDPETAEWVRRDLPVTRDVGSRPDVAYDVDDNLYVVYVSPGEGDGVDALQDYYTDGDLVIAGATKAADYTDWTILHTDTRDFAGEPFIDQNRLLEYGVLSVFIQENDDDNLGRTGTPLHILEYNIASDTTLAGDYNGDGVVDAADYTTWRDNVGAPAGTLPNDVDGGVIGQLQYATWVANFGAMSTGGGAAANGSLSNQAVPEPTTLALLVLAAAFLRRRSYSRRAK